MSVVNINRALRIGSRINNSTSGSMLYVDSNNKVAEDNDGIFFDATEIRFGIGTASPAVPLHINSATGEQLRLDDTSATGSPWMAFLQDGTRRALIQHLDSEDNLRLVSEFGIITFKTGSSGSATERIRIDSAGLVGIGKTPTTDLDVNGQVLASSDNVAGHEFIRTTALTTGARGVIRLKLDSSGSTSDGFGPAFTFAIEDSSGANENIASISAAREGADTDGGLVFQTFTSNAPRTSMVIKKDGNVGIGAGGFTPATLLELEDATAETICQISNSAADGDPYFAVALSGTRKFSWGCNDGLDDRFVYGTTDLDTGRFLSFDTSNIMTLPKASGNGIKVDITTPTFGFADIIGDQFSKNTGATKPALATYNGDVDAWQFSDGDEAFITYHIPHDYVAGTDIHLHIHWSQTSATATGGTIDFKYFAIYAKGHNQASGSVFTGTPITASFSSINIDDGSAGLTQYQQHLTEVTISAATATSALFDRDDFEPDGVIELTLEMDTNSLTNSVTVLDPFIHYADIHYQSTGLMGTKSRTPDFYA